MSFSYNPSTDIGRVRLRLSDTREQSAALSDEEIEAAITDEGSWRAAAAVLARTLYMRLARSARNYTSPDGTSVDETAALDHLRQLVEQLEAEAATTTPSATLPIVEVSTMGPAPNDPYYLIG